MMKGKKRKKTARIAMKKREGGVRRKNTSWGAGTREAELNQRGVGKGE